MKTVEIAGVLETRDDRVSLSRNVLPCQGNQGSLILLNVVFSKPLFHNENVSSCNLAAIIVPTN